ncbi:Protein TIC110 chloroplastic [Zea mays]|uniref:Protein TIC110 chloroplastic n=1 Tax=Zea mays TaxID=4577 RepID=A0A1D6EFC2_MAIZE|nr:Protein TIC110 chloroplastic [Zea mays]
MWISRAEYEESGPAIVHRKDSLTQAVEEVNIVIKFNSLLTTLSKHPEADNFARGLGPISLAGEDDHDRRADDLKILYKAYATEVLSDGIVDDKKVI